MQREADVDLDDKYERLFAQALARFERMTPEEREAEAQVERQEEQRERGERAAAKAAKAAAPSNVVTLDRKRRRRKPIKNAVGEVEMEMDVARRLLDVFGEDLRYANGIGWLVWMGTHWQRDERETSREMVKRIVANLRADAAALGDNELWKLAARVGTARGIGAVLDLARSDPRVRVNVADLDAQPWLLACANGTIDLRTGTLLEPKREHLITKCSPIAYDPTAEAPTFERFLEEVQPDPEVRAYLARLFGYASVGVVREHVLGVLWGSGANGKSVLADTLMYVLGEHAKPGPSSLICANGHHEPHPTDVASCVGSRLVAVHETKRGASFDASKVKLLTGGDKLTARYMRQDFFTFSPTHTLIMLSNYRPEADATDAALWRRVQLVHFGVTIPEERRDPELAARIRETEAAGVLAWLVRGALEWQRIGLSPPAAVREQTEAYRAAEDIIGAFLEERTVRLASVSTKASALYAAHKSWCEANGTRPVRGNDFFAELVGRGFVKRKTAGGMVYDGIGLHAEEGNEWAD